MRKILAIALALCAPWPLAAQNAITQEGTVLQNSPMMFRGNNRARQGAPVQGAPKGQIVETGDSVVGGRCDYSEKRKRPALPAVFRIRMRFVRTAARDPA